MEAANSAQMKKRPRKLRQPSGKCSIAQLNDVNRILFPVFICIGESIKSELEISQSGSELDTSSGCSSFQDKRCNRRNSSGESFEGFSSLPQYTHGYEDGGDHKSAFLPYKVDLIVLNLL